MALVFVWKSALQEGFNFSFPRVFSINKIFILVGGLGAGLSFYGFRHLSGISQFSKILSRLATRDVTRTYHAYK